MSDHDPRAILREAEEELLAVKELAAHLRVSNRTVYRMIWGRTLDERKYRAERVGGQWRIRRRVVRQRPEVALPSR